MLQSFCAPNTRVNFHGLLATVTPIGNSHIALKFDETSQGINTLTIEEATRELGRSLHFIGKGNEEKIPVDLDFDDLIELRRRRAYVEELKRVSIKGGCGSVKTRVGVIAHVQRKMNDKIGTSPASLQRWFKADNEHSQGLASTLRRQVTQPRPSTFSQEVQDCAIRAIDNYYLVPGKPSIQFAYDCFVEDVNEFIGHDAKRPCYGTFNIWVKQLTNPVDQLAVQHGKRAVRSANRKALRKLVVNRIHERVEVDAVHLAVGLVDTEDRYLGTATVFVCIDCFSRSILGIQVQVGRGESAASVIDSYKNAITPKDRSFYSPECVNTWPMYGVSEAYVGDGGPGYTAIKTIAFCEDVGTQTETVDTGKGWKKPYVESFFATLRSQFACTLPGYCGKYSDQQLNDATVQQQACMTYEQFHNALTHWIVDEYHQSPHKGLYGKTPHQVWEEQAQPSMFPPMLPANFERIKFIKGNVETRTIQGEHGHQGLAINYVFYNDPDGRLKEIYRRLKALGDDAVVTCEYSPNDISEINVNDPFTDEMFVVPTFDERIRSGMTLAEFRAAYPTPKKNKGFGHSRVARTSQTMQDVKQAHNKKMKSIGHKRSEVAHVDEITDEVHAQEELDNMHASQEPEVSQDETVTNGRMHDEPKRDQNGNDEVEEYYYG